MAIAARSRPALDAYHADPDVRARIAEFAGPGASRDDAWGVWRPVSDEQGTLLVLDVDLVAADGRLAARQPTASLAALAPARDAAAAAFARRGIAPLVLLGATGWRFVARFRAGSGLHDRLQALAGGAGWSARSCEIAAAAPHTRAYRAAGRVAEGIAHDVLRAAREDGVLPVALADVPPSDGPFVRVDPTVYAETASAATIRCAFSVEPRADAHGAQPLVVVPWTGDLAEMEAARTDLRAAAALARSVVAAVPDVPEDAPVLAQYERSALAAFHAEMDHAPLAAEWARDAHGLFDAESAPPCANAVLRYPVPRLVDPRHLRTVALALWSTGWHPRAIAALVRSRYEEPHGWGSEWRWHDPAASAEYFVRLFCASAALGLDDGRFGCDTESRLGLCPAGGCGYDLGLLLRRLRTLRARYEAHA